MMLHHLLGVGKNMLNVLSKVWQHILLWLEMSQHWHIGLSKTLGFDIDSPPPMHTCTTICFRQATKSIDISCNHTSGSCHILCYQELSSECMLLVIVCIMRKMCNMHCEFFSNACSSTTVFANEGTWIADDFPLPTLAPKIVMQAACNAVWWALILSSFHAKIDKHATLTSDCLQLEDMLQHLTQHELHCPWHFVMLVGPCCHYLALFLWLHQIASAIGDLPAMMCTSLEDKNKKFDIATQKFCHFPQLFPLRLETCFKMLLFVQENNVVMTSPGKTFVQFVTCIMCSQFWRACKSRNTRDRTPEWQ